LADEGNETVLLLATKGDAGKKNDPVSHLSNEEFGAVRKHWRHMNRKYWQSNGTSEN
jgi:hypothetical protein